MNRFHLLSVLGLIVIGVAFPVYAAREPARLAAAAEAREQVYVAEGAAVYVENCAVCHGAEGEGIGYMPALDDEALAAVEARVLFQVIARAAHGTGMAAWHADAGGMLNDYQIGALVSLIRAGSWEAPGRQLASGGNTPLPVEMSPEDVLMAVGGIPGPHDCVSCHEEPEVHAERFGLNCANCHTLQAWTPALLSRHGFALDHGGDALLDCVVCHVESYVTYTCYGCHDHLVVDMESVHLEEGIVDLAGCATCHPTGAQGEAGELAQSPWGGNVHSGGDGRSGGGGGGR